MNPRSRMCFWTLVPPPSGTLPPLMMACPPMSLSASTRMTEQPASRATIAAGSPVAPAPLTTTSPSRSELTGSDTRCSVSAYRVLVLQSEVHGVSTPCWSGAIRSFHRDFFPKQSGRKAPAIAADDLAQERTRFYPYAGNLPRRHDGNREHEASQSVTDRPIGSRGSFCSQGSGRAGMLRSALGRS